MNFGIGKKWLGALLLALLFSACGGGGGSSGTSAASADTTAPSTSAIAIGAGAASSSSTVVTLDISATDSVGVSAYFASETATTPAANDAGWAAVTSATNFTATVTFTLSSGVLGNNTKTVYVWFKDAAGNVSVSANDAITLVVSDTAAPTSPAISINIAAVSTTSTAVTLDVSATDSVGITAYYASETATTPAANDAGWAAVTPATNYTATVTFTLSSGALGNNTKTVYVWFKDAAGNVSVSANDAITLVVSDTVSPSVPAAAINAGAASTLSTAVTLDISATDAIGVTAYFASETATTPAATDAGWTTIAPATNYTATVNFTLSAGAVGNNTKTVYVWFKDAAGNVSVSANDAITLVVSDTAAPTSPAISINIAAASTTSTAVTLGISATDNVGVTAYFASETATTPAATDAGWTTATPATNYTATVNFTLSAGALGNNTKTVYVWFKDAAGNVSAQASDAITLIVSDATAPASPAISINTAAASTTSTSVTLGISATDNVGVTAYFASETASTPAANDAGWTAVTPATNYSATANFTLSAGVVGNNTKTVYVWFKDAAGNVSASANDAITLVVSDATAPASPTISINAGAASTTSMSVTLDISATDTVGVTAYFASETATTPAATDAGWAAATPATNYTATVNFTLSAGMPGDAKTVYVWFKDAAGNVSVSANDAITLGVAPPISAIATTTAQSLNVGITMPSFSPLTPGGGATPYTYSYTGILPSGLNLDPNTGAVTGIPGVAYATANVVFSVKDANNVVATTTSTVSFTVSAAVPPLNTVSTIAGAPPYTDGIGALARFNSPEASVSDGTNLYVADSSNHIIRKIVLATGEVTTLAGTAGVAWSADGIGTAAYFDRPSGITTVSGNLYVTAGDAIRKIVIATGEVTTLAGAAAVVPSGSVDGIGTAARFYRPYGITTDNANLYVTDYYNLTIRKIVIATGEVTTLAGQVGVTGSADGIGALATFNYASGITTDNTNLYVADLSNQTIRKIVIATGAVSTLAGQVGVTGFADGTGTAATFTNPKGITTDNTNLYVTDVFNHTIRQIVISTGAVTTLAGTVGVKGSVDATGTAATFNYPYGITSNGGNLYVADTFNNIIRKIVIASRVVTTLAGIPPGTDGIGAAASFYDPSGIATDGSNLYVADYSSHTIRKIVMASGAVTTLAGAAGAGGAVDATGAAARFGYPSGITYAGGSLYVSEYSNISNTIRKIVVATGVVTTLAGTAGVSGAADATGAAASFKNPNSITTDGSNLYVADTNNHTIRKIVIASGVVTTLAGAAGVSGATDATGAAARFSLPTGITTDGSNLYVTDSGNSAIRQIVIASGVVTTLAGTAGASGAADGIGAVANFNYPTGITVLGSNLYVKDAGNSTIRKIEIATGTVTTPFGMVYTPGSADGISSAARFKTSPGITHAGSITSDGTNLFVTDSGNHTIRKIQ